MILKILDKQRKTNAKGFNPKFQSTILGEGMMVSGWMGWGVQVSI